MKRTKVIKGRPNYVYKGHNYLDQPEKTIRKKMLYDEVANVTNVYCKRPSILFELVCLVCIMLCILFNKVYLHNSAVKVYYNSITTYYNNSLYVNLKSDDSNNVEVRYYISNNSTIIKEGVLNPGDTIISIPIDSVEETYNLNFEYDTLFSTKSESVSINVIDRSN